MAAQQSHGISAQRRPDGQDLLAQAKPDQLTLCAGQGPYEQDALADTQALAQLLQTQGLPVHLEVWGYDVAHDWYWWGRQWNLFAERLFGQGKEE